MDIVGEWGVGVRRSREVREVGGGNTGTVWRVERVYRNGSI